MRREKDIKRFMKKQYAKVARKGDSCCSSDFGPSNPIEQAKAIGYSQQEIRSVPEEAVMGMGCANPIALAELKDGETVLDLGCGGGFDAFLAAHKVGQKGKVIGIDMTPEMIKKAAENAVKGNYRNVEFKLGEIENLPLEDSCVDVAISNCVINHSPDKLATFKEVFRVLKPSGRILMADLVTEEEFAEDVLDGLDKVWAEWIAGAVGKQEYLNTVREAGFRNVAIAAEKLFSMSEMDDRLKGKIISIQVKAYKSGRQE